MANQFALNGGQPQKPTRFTDIYNGRWSSGIWTNRSPLRDAVTQRWQEKFYGAAGDALIAGLNCEITNRLTLARRPGNPIFDDNSYDAVDSYYSFHLSNTAIEQINVMIDEADSLFSLFNGVKSLVWSKSAGAGQSFFQQVGNTLFFGNGIDNKKWLQTLNTWSSDAQWGTPTTPFMTTFLIDGNGNIQQLTGAVLTVTHVATDAGPTTLTVTANTNLEDIISVGEEITFPSGMAATWLSGQTVTVLTVGTNTFTAVPPTGAVASYSASESNKIAPVVQGGTPISGNSAPSWSTTVPSAGNNFQGGITIDGSAQWTNRGNPVENWGIIAPPGPPVPVVGSSRVAWTKDTFYSFAGVIIDSNGNLQQVTVPGKSGSSTPTWATSKGNTTTDGTITWTMIQTAAELIWASGTAYTAGWFLVGNAGGQNCLFQLAPISTPYINGTINCNGWNSTSSGGFNKYFPAPTADFTFTAASLSWHNAVSQNTQIDSINGAGTVTGQTDTGHYENWEAAIVGTLHVRVPGQYSFTLSHDDGAFIGFNTPAQLVSGALIGDLIPHTQMAVSGYPVFGGNNSSGSNVDTVVVNFPTAGDYGFEIDWTNWEHASQMLLTCNGQTIVPTGTPISGTTEPIWPAWSTSFAPNYPSVKESANQFQWNNLGPATDYVWAANINFTTADQTIIDSAGNTEAPYRAGVTGSTAPTFAGGLNQLTNDNPNLIWINQGAASAPPPGTLSTFNGGWIYGIALVNTLDDTVSNCSQLSPATGNFIGAEGVTFAPGSGLPDLATIDPQCDYVAIFRTTDGQAVEFLINGTGNSIYTVSLADYIVNGYTDTTPDTGLDNLVQAAVNGENTPPPAGAVNLTYHLNRIFFSVNEVVYWTTGPDAPVGNGTNGVSPLNFDDQTAAVKRIVPQSNGALVFTVSDVLIISGYGTQTSPIQDAVPYLPGIGLLSYNALDINGTTIGLYTTDKQFIVFDPSAGVSYCGFPIGDQLRKNSNTPGTAWNPASVYVAWHTEGEDQAWYLSDGQFGWFRLCTTPAPETGYTWSPYAQIIGGCKAVQSVEVLPGVHKLLVGPTATGPILNRDLDTFTDNGSQYDAFAVLGSIVLAQPGQVAEISSITIDTVRVGLPLTLGVIFDEALPYYTGPFDTLTISENDPPNTRPSRSIRSQRFYVNDLKVTDTALCRHMQIRINFGTSSVQNELMTLTVFGGFMQEG